MLFDKLLAVLILLTNLRQVMNAPVHFNNKPGSSTIKIHHIDSDHVLSQESQAIATIIAQSLPELLLRLRRFVS